MRSKADFHARRRAAAREEYAVVSWAWPNGYSTTYSQHGDYGDASAEAARLHAEAYGDRSPGANYIHFIPIIVERFEAQHGELPPPRSEGVRTAPSRGARRRVSEDEWTDDWAGQLE